LIFGRWLAIKQFAKLIKGSYALLLLQQFQIFFFLNFLESFLCLRLIYAHNLPRISSLNPAVVWIEYADSTLEDHIERITSTITVEVDSLACLKHSNLQVLAEGKLIFC